MQLQTTLPESQFPNEYRNVIFIQIDQHLNKLLQKYKGSRFYETQCSFWQYKDYAGIRRGSREKQLQTTVGSRVVRASTTRVYSSVC